MPVKNGTFGPDTLYGGGPDTLIGGQNNDTYIVYTNEDRVVEEEVGGGGFSDAVYTFSSYDLGINNSVELLSAAVHASTDPLVLIGSKYDQTIIGNYGNNTIRGNGGFDTLRGLAGDDIYVIARGTVLENAGEGNDIVYLDAFGSFILAQGSSVETISALEQAGTTSLYIAGNELTQFIAGNMGDNTLVSGGGNDTLVGLGGNDIYRVAAGDTVIETAGGGTDTIFTLATNYMLTAGNSVEVLRSYYEAGTDAVNLMGNELSQLIGGTNGANILNGGGGVDTMIGYGGDDIYRVYDARDVVIEYGEGGNDTVYTSSSYALAPNMSVETLSAADQGFTTAIHLTGNNLANRVIGNMGDNIIDGGAGSDTLIGLGGADSFRFATPLGAGNVDTITDFGNGADWILLDAGIFTGLTAGALPASAIAYGAAAADADDRVIYNPLTGALLFDADGNGAGAAIQFAQLATGIAQSAIQVRVESGYTATVTGAQVTEGNAGTTPMVFTVTLDRAASSEVLLNFATLTSGTAASDDFAAVNGTVSIAAGQRSATFSVNITGDSFYEFAETVQVQLVGAQLQAPVTGTGTILNDDTTLYLNTGGTILAGGATGSGTSLEATYPGATTVYLGPPNFLTASRGHTLVIGPNLNGLPDIRVADTDSATALDLSQLGTGVRMVSGADLVTTEGQLVLKYAATTFNGPAWQTVTGSAFDDYIDRRGDQEPNRQFYPTAATVNGGAGNDTIIGVSVANGGAGNDRLVASIATQLTGGEGADIFVLPLSVRTPNTNFGISPNVVTDFDPATDKIELVLNRTGEWRPITLVPGALPAEAFGIGAEPSLSSHRVLYDPVTGNLNFDEDGYPGSNYLRPLFATLPPGLTLTADNFTLVAP